MLVSSSSAPMPGFCTITLKTGADRSGKTSRGSSKSQKAPSAAPPRAMAKARSGLAKKVRMMRAIIAQWS